MRRKDRWRSVGSRPGRLAMNEKESTKTRVSRKKLRSFTIFLFRLTNFSSVVSMHCNLELAEDSLLALAVSNWYSDGPTLEEREAGSAVGLLFECVDPGGAFDAL